MGQVVDGLRAGLWAMSADPPPFIQTHSGRYLRCSLPPQGMRNPGVGGQAVLIPDNTSCLDSKITHEHFLSISNHLETIFI